MSRNLLAQVAIAEIPKILTLMDRNPHSSTYGCCDRNFWQYKIIDFPSGMAQEFALPLSLVYSLNLPNNPFYQQPDLRAWVKASLTFAAQNSHPDGSCDDYFPFERASGAAAFSLFACIESYRLLKLNDDGILEFFEKRADWLAKHRESGRLANHEALIVLCLQLLRDLLKTSKWDRVRARRLERLLSWQSSEGWFQEYGGFDPGYHTLTISCLALLQDLQPNDTLKKVLLKAVQLASEFIHPDGSYGGEYGSRNTYNFFPHGFELVGRWYPDALSINDTFLKGVAMGKLPCYADDHIVGHHVWNYLLAWKDFVPHRPPNKPRPTGRIWLQQAGILIDRRQDVELYLALNKGGVFKLFRHSQILASDTQISVQVKQGKRLQNAVGHLIGNYDISLTENTIYIRGNLGWSKQTQMTPLKLITLRIVTLSIGRFFPNLIRSILQKILITGNQKAPFEFARQMDWQNGQWQITDQLKAKSWKSVHSVGIGSHQTSIYVVMSRVFQEGQLQPWLDLTHRVKTLGEGQALMVTRSL